MISFLKRFFGREPMEATQQEKTYIELEQEATGNLKRTMSELEEAYNDLQRHRQTHYILIDGRLHLVSDDIRGRMLVEREEHMILVRIDEGRRKLQRDLGEWKRFQPRASSIEPAPARR